MVEGIVDHPLGAKWKPHVTHCVDARCLSHGNEIPWQLMSPHGWFRAEGAATTHIRAKCTGSHPNLSDPLRGTQGRTVEYSQVRDDEPMSGWAEDDVIHPDVSVARILYDELMEGTRSADDVASDPILDKISRVLQTLTESLTNDRTAKLWLQYMDMVKILRKFIKAEHMGNWSLHLEAVVDMLPYLAASGHSLYAKSARIYLQTMLSLNRTIQMCAVTSLRVSMSPEEVVELDCPLMMIEQVLMRSMNTIGGLTRGRGMTEQQWLTSLLSMPACSETTRAMQELTV